MSRADWLQAVCATADDGRDYLMVPGCIVAPDGTPHDMATNGHMALVLPAGEPALPKHAISLPAQTAWMFADRQPCATVDLDTLRAWACCPSSFACPCCGVSMKHPHGKRVGTFGPAALNLAFVGAVLSRAPGETVRISWDGPNAPVFFDGDGWRGIVIGLRGGEAAGGTNAGPFPGAQS